MRRVYLSSRHIETLERAPHIDHYRNLMSVTDAMQQTQPTVAELRSGKTTAKDDDVEAVAPVNSADTTTSTKFGWFQGEMLNLEEE